ncbi:hypothetical protein CTheo_9033 [Ceratobasidium theobromae]|uniref:Uncharacterized protein n=1 Tax=Ceratobasidium theobromae TaxID=1582974 RepID=A0A5N5Q803_9AGAM|nr:hypothetical protein CTheo_9033 [Ceratobasidium theobromae]
MTTQEESNDYKSGGLLTGFGPCAIGALFHMAGRVLESALGLFADTKDVGIPDISHNKIKTTSLPTPSYLSKSSRLVLLYETSGTITS